MIGKVIEVFIPEEYIDNELIDIMYSSRIGFRVKLEDKIVTIVLKQNNLNSKIFREDIVKLIMDETTNEFIDIELYKGDVYAG